MAQKYDDKLLDHDADGIQEFDNNLPRWWLYGFYFTIAFALVYMVMYHVTGSAPLSKQEYEQEMQVAEAINKSKPKKQLEIKVLNNASGVNAERGMFLRYVPSP